MKILSGLFLAAALTFSPTTFPGAQDGDRSQSFTVQAGGSLVVDVAPGNVEIRPWDKNEVHILAENIDEGSPDRLAMTQSGNTVNVEYRDRRRRSQNVDFTIQVPATFNVAIKTTGGKVRQYDQLTGAFSVDTKGGGTRFETIIGDVEVRSGGGEIKGKLVRGNGKVRTGGGSVELDHIEGDAELESGGGSIEVNNVGKTLTLVTGGGNVKVGDVGSKAELRTGGGNLDVGRVNGDLKLSSGGGNVDVEGAMGHANVSSGGGNVRVAKVEGSIALKTGGGNVVFGLIPSAQGRSTVHSGGGDIQVNIPEGAKATVEARIRLKSSRSWKKYDIRSDFKADTYEKDEDDDEIRGMYSLNGGGHNIRVETTNGDIALRKMK